VCVVLQVQINLIEHTFNVRRWPSIPRPLALLLPGCRLLSVAACCPSGRCANGRDSPPQAFAALHTAYRLLKPGGFFVFSERVVKLHSYSQIYHPVRLTTAFYDAFLSKHYDEVYRFRGMTDLVKGKPFVENELYYIGRRKSPSAWL
jgi:hypothetical protein